MSADTTNRPAAHADLQQRLRNTELLILDVDGVLTDGRLHYGPDGEALKVFNAQDGHAIKQLQATGLAVAIISGRSSEMVTRRAAELGIRHVYQGSEDKGFALEALERATGRPPEVMAHMGDDIPDLELFDAVGLALAPANAHPEVLRRADWVSTLPGGAGAVREAAALFLEALRSR